jgi:ABC-type transport system involved in cytochrome c biogenesis permease component
MFDALVGPFVTLVVITGFALGMYQLLQEMRRISQSVQQIAEVLRRMDTNERLFQRPVAPQQAANGGPAD